MDHEMLKVRMIAVGGYSFIIPCFVVSSPALSGIVEWVRQKTDPNYKPPPEAVITLTQENFDQYTSDQDIVLVEFYAPWYVRYFLLWLCIFIP